MKTLFLILIFLCCLISSAQKQASNWYFGENAGINFNLDTGVITTLNDSQINTREGCASISDTNGFLLFYTDGTTVWDRSQNIMQNGTGLLGNSSSTQSAIIVPKPEDTNIYYIFTTSTASGLNFSVVDIRLNNGLGAITTKNNPLLSHCTEKLTAVLKDCNTESVWVITLAPEEESSSPIPAPTNTFHAFEVNTLGVTTQSIKSVMNFSFSDPRGSLRLSPNGNKLINANMQEGLTLYNFDTNTGIVTFNQALTINGSGSLSYGVEFSPNSQLLYAHSSDLDSNGATTNSSTLTQFNLEAPDIEASQIVIDNRATYRGGLQLGPNGKIYHALSLSYFIGSPFLGVINNPNEIGTACNYQYNAISLGNNNSTQGLPPFITSLFIDKIDIIQNGISTTDLSLCNGDNYTLIAENIPGATYTWTLNDIILTETDSSLAINNTTGNGEYKVIINLNNSNCGTLKGIANVTFSQIPELENNETLLYCLNDFPSTITLDSGLNDSVDYYSFNWNTGETTESIEVNTTGTFTITVTNNTTSCYKTRTIIVEPSNIATINTINVIDGSLNNNKIIILTSGEGEYEYALTDYEGNTTPFQNTNAFKLLTPGIYTITIKDTKNNCGSINRDISIIAFPLYFTPNGDSINDTWQVYGVSSVFQPNSEITIFDRFGKLITQIKASSRGWDGTYKSRPLPESDYWFYVKLQDGREYRNHFTLKR